MRLLVVTQAVDAADPLLGFFHRWLLDFSRNVERVEVVCLREGTHALPANVRVHALRKGKLARGSGFLRLAWSLRGDYDAVFIHMNPEYVVIGGWLWKLMGKPIALWYTHKHVDLKLRIAEAFSDAVLTASKESFRLPSQKLRVMGHGIDTDFYTPGGTRGAALLSVGRLMKSKRHDLCIRAAARAGRKLRIVGDGPERENLAALAKEVGASVTFLGSLTGEAVREEYRSAYALLHASETGSLDKVVLEALACGTPVVTTSEAYPDAPVAHSAADPEALAAALLAPVPAEPAYVREHHSLARLVPAILRVYPL